MRTQKEIIIDLIKSKGFKEMTNILMEEHPTFENINELATNLKSLINEVNEAFHLDIQISDFLEE